MDKPHAGTNLIQLCVTVNGTSRAYALPFHRVQKFEDFTGIVDDLLQECNAELKAGEDTEKTPRPGSWDVVGPYGIVKALFWSDLVQAGEKYSLIPRRAPEPVSMANTCQLNAEVPPPYIPQEPLVDPTGTRHDSPAVHSTSNRTYAESVTSNKRLASNDSNRAPSHLVLPSTAESSAPISHDDQRSLWTPIARKSRMSGNLMKITLRDRDTCSFMKSINFNKNKTVAELIEALGGKEGIRVQLLMRAEGGYRPGLSYMWGTMKTLTEAGWDQLGSTIDLCLY